VTPCRRQLGQVVFEAVDLPEQVGGLFVTRHAAVVEQSIAHVLEPLPRGLPQAIDGAVARQVVDQQVEIGSGRLAAGVEPLSDLTDLEFQGVAGDHDR
jgi:hypothetical protein